MGISGKGRLPLDFNGDGRRRVALFVKCMSKSRNGRTQQIHEIIHCET